MRCPVCESSNFKELDFGGYFYHNQKMPLTRCEFCSLKYIVHNLSDDDIQSFYNEEEYFDSEYAGGAIKDYGSNKENQDIKADRALNVIKKYRPSGKLLEIGCAGGYFLLRAKRLGYDVKGVEVSDKMCRLAERIGLDVFCGELKDLPEGSGNFDVVYLGDILEHVASPNEFIVAVRGRMALGGIVTIELPLTYNWTLSGLAIGIVNLFRGRFGYKYFLPAQHRQSFMAKPPYHLLMFNRRSVKYFLAANDLKVKYLSIYDGLPKEKFQRNAYHWLKRISNFITLRSGQNFFGDRCLVIAQKV